MRAIGGLQSRALIEKECTNRKILRFRRLKFRAAIQTFTVSNDRIIFLARPQNPRPRRSARTTGTVNPRLQVLPRRRLRSCRRRSLRRSFLRHLQRRRLRKVSRRPRRRHARHSVLQILLHTLPAFSPTSHFADVCKTQNRSRLNSFGTRGPIGRGSTDAAAVAGAFGIALMIPTSIPSSAAAANA